MSTRYGTFIENYNNGNVFLDKVAQGFFDRISYDVAQVSNSDDAALKTKFKLVKDLLADPRKNSYDKIMDLANLIDDVMPVIAASPEKKNVINMVYGLLDVAKATEDSTLIEKSMKIATQLVPQ